MNAALLRRLFAPALILLMIAVLLLREPGDPELIDKQIYVLGTQVTVSVPSSAADAEVITAAMGKVGVALNTFQRTWQPEGESSLGSLNARLATSKTAAVPEELQPLISKAQALAQNSGQTFDPGIAKLVQLWGFDDAEAFRDAPPTQSEIDTLLAQPHLLAKATVDADSLRAAAPGLALDMGGIAKGTAVALALDVLRDTGIEHALVNAGGDMQAMGQVGRRPWHIAIRHPRPTDTRRLLAALDVRDGEAVFTSGDYERFFEHDGQRYHHLLDPRTGLPARGAQSATVLHTDAAVADAAATALFVAGKADFIATANALGITHALLIDASGNALATAAMQDRLEWLSNTEVELVELPQ